MAGLTNRASLGYSLATPLRPRGGLDVLRSTGIGIVVRTYTALNPANDIATPAGVEGAFRLVLIPGAL